MQSIRVGISGATSSGKSSVSRLLQKEFENCILIHQDEYYKVWDKLRFIHLQEDKFIPIQDGYANWEAPESLNFDSLRESIQQQAKEENEILICEGFLLFHTPSLLKELDIKIFLSINYETCKKRRFARDEWLRENPIYFDKFIWPSYENYWKQIQEMKDIEIINTENLSIDEVALLCKKQIEKLRTTRNHKE